MFLFPLTSRVLMILLLYCYCDCIQAAAGVCLQSTTLHTTAHYRPVTVIGARARHCRVSGLCRARAVRCRPLVTSPVRGQSPGPGLGSPGQQPRGEMSADCCHHQPRPAKQPSRPTSIFSNHSFHFLSLGSLSSNNTSMIWGSKSMTHS